MGKEYEMDEGRGKGGFVCLNWGIPTGVLVWDE